MESNDWPVKLKMNKFKEKCKKKLNYLLNKGAHMLVPTRGGNKKFYTRQDDEQVVALAGEGKSTKEIAVALGRSEASISYRINRVLNKPGVKSLDDIKYKGEVAPTAVVAEEPAADVDAGSDD